MVLITGIGIPALATDEDDVIFDGGTSDFFSGGALARPLTIIAVDFELQTATKLRDVHVDVEQFLSFPGIAEFEYKVYSDSVTQPGIPGDLIQEGEGINEHKEELAQPTERASLNFRYWFDLDTPLFLEAGTTYWIELTVTNSPFEAAIFWWTTSPGFGSPAANTSDRLSWFEDSNQLDMNIVLTGGDDIVGGELLSIDSTALLLSSAQSFSWMIPVVLSVVGIGLFVVSRKSENS